MRNWFSYHGSKTVLSGDTIELGSAASVWLVQKGTVTIFSAEGGLSNSELHQLLTVNEGELFFGFPKTTDSQVSMSAKGALNTELLEVSLADYFTHLKETPKPTELLRLEAWLNKLTEAIQYTKSPESLLKLDTNDDDFLIPAQTDVSSPVFCWVSLLSGAGSFLNSLSMTTPQDLMPLSHKNWITLTKDSHLVSFSTQEVLERGALQEMFISFHQALLPHIELLNRFKVRSRISHIQEKKEAYEETITEIESTSGYEEIQTPVIKTSAFFKTCLPYIVLTLLGEISVILGLTYWSNPLFKSLFSNQKSYLLIALSGFGVLIYLSADILLRLRLNSAYNTTQYLTKDEATSIRTILSHFSKQTFKFALIPHLIMGLTLYMVLLIIHPVTALLFGIPAVLTGLFANSKSKRIQTESGIFTAAKLGFERYFNSIVASRVLFQDAFTSISAVQILRAKISAIFTLQRNRSSRFTYITFLKGLLLLSAFVAPMLTIPGFLMNSLTQFIALQFGLLLVAYHLLPVFDYLLTPLSKFEQHEASLLGSLRDDEGETPDITGVVRLENVCFSYSEKSPFSLERISLTAKPGDRIAIVGKSGSGKSTLSRLLSGQLIPDSGYIMLGTHLLTKISKVHLRTQLMVITDDERPIGISIRDYLNADSEIDSQAALSQSGFLPIVSTLAEGLDTVLTTHTLSPTQYYHLLLAKCMVMKPKVIVIDGCLSRFNQLLQDVFFDCIATVKATTFLLSNRLKELDKFDHLLILENGKVKTTITKDKMTVEAVKISPSTFHADVWTSLQTTPIKEAVGVG